MRTEGLLRRTAQTLPDERAVQCATMAWLEEIVARQDRVYRLTSGLDDEPDRFTLAIWSGHDLVGAFIASQVFKDGEWLLTTYDLGGTAR